MSINLPQKAFILAAGMGSRLRPYTDTMPKPMVPVEGRALIDHTLEHLEQVGVTDVTVNIHYMADKIQSHLAAHTRGPRVTFSYEPSLLDTGGGIKKALHTMENQPFFCFSGDALWEDGSGGNTLERMASAFDPDKMDLLLLLQPVDKMVITAGTHDYNLSPAGPVRSRETPKTGKFFWPSIRIIHPRLFDDTPDGPFSFLTLMDRAEAAGRLGALEHDGTCHHITTPDDLNRVNAHYTEKTPHKTGSKVA